MVGFVGGFAVTRPATRRHVCTARGAVRMTATHGDVKSERRPGSHKGFVEEMRFVAMRLHTRDQAKEGEQEKSALPINEWKPKKEDYLQFLVDSKYVYDYMEGIVEEGKNDMLARFKNSGLERSEALAKDIKWFQDQGFTTPEPTAYATRYVDYLKKLVDSRPNAFLCHWYNYYFAHTAGGRMIGRMMSNMLFDGRELEFYHWDRDVKEILGEVRKIIDEVAKDWPREEKDDCLKETQLAFSYSGTVLGNLAKA
eukprot:Plantae.Rhodophyta-Purpureofilum_apyrenoidigerum.ctg19822.p1 GENE.Plantae.Rhodophyta-Purpureofilum_apyrenoidigerum.ctg19822~~Plantae.Rhodophyta-Purpureofilum_apyrenoidigerum.ctg19822.p1  ORF type:complete len:254 (+),score=48.64 Plantae.Rhodophyta-Purpureofilum_apyrenoidigerum.ctg19822:78-839(+)